MPRSADDVLALYAQRRQDLAGAHSRMKLLADTYNGDRDLVLPELDAIERSGAPNLVAQGLDQLAMRVASTDPMPWFPSQKPGIRRHDAAARTRREVVLGWWESNKLNIKGRRRARQLLGYASTPVMLRPDFKKKMPVWDVYSPMRTFPAPCADPDDMTPSDCIYTSSRPLRWLLTYYPEKVGALAVGPGKPQLDDLYDVLTYVDDHETIMCVLGKDAEHSAYTGGNQYNRARIVELERYPNRAGICPAVVPGRISLDRAMGAFDSILGMLEMQGTLLALETEAIKRGIFPEPWLEAYPNENPQVIDVADGPRGKVGRVKGGKLQWERVDASFAALQAIDRYERNARVTAAIPADWGGESATNIRTARRGGEVMSATVDYSIQEHQELLAEARREEDMRAIAIDKAYFSGRKSIAVGWKGGNRKVGAQYDTSIWDEGGDLHVVKFSLLGADANSLVVSAGQRVGIGEMSKQTMREVDPMIDDPELEERRVTVEAIDAAGLSAIQTQAANGEIPPADLAFIKKRVLAGDSWEDAVEAAQKNAQERQAAQVAPTDPAAQPGLSMPNMGAEAGVAAIQEPPDSMTNLSRIMMNLRGGVATENVMQRQAAG